MESVLVVSSSEKGEAMLRELLKNAAFSQIDLAKNGNEARRLMSQQRHDELVIINTPLSDELGHELAMTLAESSDAGIMMLVKGEYADEIAHKVEDYGVFVVPKPLFVRPSSW